MGIDGKTQLVGIIANPIAHVRTPQLFNESIARQGLNAVCVPFHVLGDDLSKTLQGIGGARNFIGMIVTIPYKERVIDFCTELTETAKLVGSANVLRFDHERGVWVGGNFDGEGFIAGLRGRGHELRGKRVLLLGSGGAGKAIAYSVTLEQPAELVIYNRTMARAEELVERLRSVAFQANVHIQAGDNDPADFDVIINATSLGLHDNDELPLPVENLLSDSLVCEAVVRNGNTPLLAAAERKSCNIHHGQHMLYGQIVQISRFLGFDLRAESVAHILGP